MHYLRLDQFDAQSGALVSNRNVAPTLHSTQNWTTTLPFTISIAPVLDLAGFGHVVPEFLHVPGGGGEAVGAPIAGVCSSSRARG